MGHAGVLPCWFALSPCRRCPSVRAAGESHATPGQSAEHRDWRPRPRPLRHNKFDITLDGPHLAVRMFLLTTFIHAHCQGRDHRKLGSREDEPPWPGAHRQLLVSPPRLITAIKFVSGQFSTAYRSTIGTDFITKTLPHHSKPDEFVTLQIWVRRYHFPTTSTFSSSPVAHTTIGYCRTRTLFIPLFCIFPWSGCRHSHL